MPKIKKVKLLDGSVYDIGANSSNVNYDGTNLEFVGDNITEVIDLLSDKADDKGNVIEIIKRNGATLPIVSKAVDIEVPTKVTDLTDADDYAKVEDIPTKTSDLTNDGENGLSPYATEAYVDAHGGKIDKIKVNGVVQPINPVDKSVDITVPTKMSELENDDYFVSDEHYVHTDNNYTDAEVTKLEGIEEGAERNVQSDWNEEETDSDAFIKNKPSIPTKVSDLTNDTGFITGITTSSSSFVKTVSAQTTSITPVAGTTSVVGSREEFTVNTHTFGDPTDVAKAGTPVETVVNVEGAISSIPEETGKLVTTTVYSAGANTSVVSAASVDGSDTFVKSYPGATTSIYPAANIQAVTGVTYTTTTVYGTGTTTVYGTGTTNVFASASVNADQVLSFGSIAVSNGTARTVANGTSVTVAKTAAASGSSSVRGTATTVMTGLGEAVTGSAATSITTTKVNVAGTRSSVTVATGAITASGTGDVVMTGLGEPVAATVTKANITPAVANGKAIPSVTTTSATYYSAGDLVTVATAGTSTTVATGVTSTSGSAVTSVTEM